MTATLSYLFSSFEPSRTPQILQNLQERGVNVLPSHIFEQVSHDDEVTLYETEVENALEIASEIACSKIILVTHFPDRYSRFLTAQTLEIWEVAKFLNLIQQNQLYLLNEEQCFQPEEASTPMVAQHPAAESEEHPDPATRFIVLAILRRWLQSKTSQENASTPVSSKSSGSRPIEPIPAKKATAFHAPTASKTNLADDLPTIGSNSVSQAGYEKLNQLVTRSFQFSGLVTIVQASTNYDRSYALPETTQQLPASIPASSAQNYNLSTLTTARNTERQRTSFPNRASPEFFELKGDPSVSIPTSFTLTRSNFNNPTVAFDDALLLRTNALTETLRVLAGGPSLPVDRPDSISPTNPISNPTPSNDRPTPTTIETRDPSPQVPEDLIVLSGAIVPPDPVVITPPQILDGAGGTRSFTLTTGSYEIRNFGGVGTSRVPSEDIVREVDTLYFQGSQLIAKNLLLNQQGKDLVMTFEGVQDISILIKNFELEDLDNFLTESNVPTMLGNIVFNGETSIQDSFDVLNVNAIITQIFNRNSVTFLNNLDNEVTGFDDSNDVINGQEGNDSLQGLGGDDILRGGAGDDILWGGTGNDILDGGAGNNQLTGGDGADVFRLHQGGFSEVTDFQAGIDRIGLPADIQLSEVAIEQGTGLNSSSTLIRFKPDGLLLMSLSGIAASSLTTDIFLPNASSLMRE
ncbi:calcium-binding protein [Phormidesmis sp. 146-12]